MNRDDGQQNMTGLNVTTAPVSRQPSGAFPYCPEVAIAQLGDPEHKRTGRAGLTRLPGRQPDRKRDDRHGRRLAPALHRGRGLPGRPVKGRAAQPRRGGSRGFWSIRPRQRDGPLGDQHRPGHRPGDHHIRPDSPDPRRSPTAAAHDPGQSRPPGLHAQPDGLQPLQRRTTVVGDEGGSVELVELLPGRQLRQHRLRPEAGPEAASGSTKRRGHPALQATVRAQPRRSEHRPRPR